MWELRTRELVSHLKEHTLPVKSIALYEDNFHAISCSRDRSILCWDLRSERRITSHQQRMGGINSVALSKDQTMVLTVGQEVSGEASEEEQSAKSAKSAKRRKN